jgi:hypothetical protein
LKFLPPASLLEQMKVPLNKKKGPIPTSQRIANSLNTAKFATLDFPLDETGMAAIGEEADLRRFDLTPDSEVVFDELKPVGVKKGRRIGKRPR